MEYHKDMIISDIIYDNPEVLEVFEKYGLPCRTCSGAEWETLEIAARVHGCNIDNLLRDLNALKE